MKVINYNEQQNSTVIYSLDRFLRKTAAFRALTFIHKAFDETGRPLY